MHSYEVPDFFGPHRLLVLVILAVNLHSTCSGGLILNYVFIFLQDARKAAADTNFLQVGCLFNQMQFTLFI